MANKKEEENEKKKIMVNMKTLNNGKLSSYLRHFVQENHCAWFLKKPSS